ncbi:hypothetical protein AAC387_Pa01g1810 [Persea americana]
MSNDVENAESNVYKSKNVTTSSAEVQTTWHSTVVGTIGLLICMLGGVLFQQSSSKPKADEPEETRNHNGEQKKLLEMETIPDSNNSEKPVDSGEPK